MSRLIRIDDFPHGDKSMYGLNPFRSENSDKMSILTKILCRPPFLILKLLELCGLKKFPPALNAIKTEHFMRISYRKQVRQALSIFEKHRVPYVLGASPMLLRKGDIGFLNSLVKFGNICMHGFTHAWEFEPWSHIVQTWPKGGEFMNMNKAQIAHKYMISDSIMRNIKRYTNQHFIPPF